MLEKRICFGVMFIIIAFASLETRADLLEDFRWGLGAAGFKQQINRSYLQNGQSLSFSQDFSDKEYEFGFAEIALTGTLQGEIGYNKRPVPGVELKLKTPNGGITYNYSDIIGGKKYYIENGLINADTEMEINKYGIYDIQLHTTNKATLICDDPNIPSIPLSFETGPINLHGQVLIDLINLIFGREVLPGGAAYQIPNFPQLVSQQMEKAVADYYAQADTPAGLTLSPVPEPATLLFLTLGTTLVLRRRR
jgi:hypothetical protein